MVEQKFKMKVLEEEALLRLCRKNRTNFSGGREPISGNRSKIRDGTHSFIDSRRLWGGVSLLGKIRRTRC